MSRFFSILIANVITLSLTTLSAEDAFTSKEIPIPLSSSENHSLGHNPQSATVVSDSPEIAKLPIVKKASFRAFTGKVKGNKVRIRLQPDLSAKIVKEIHKNDLVAVVDEEGDFWAVLPSDGIKAYVFRSLVLDNVVEGNRVNVRLEPNLDSPVIGILNSGDRVKSTVSPVNSKWLEIAPPAQTKFYIAKEFVDNIGSPELKAQLDKKKTTLEQLLEGAALLSKAEMLKSFEQIEFDRIKKSYETIIQQFADFPEHTELAKTTLASLLESYLEKRVSYLENKTSGQSSEAGSISQGQSPPNDRMKMWEPIEEALYLAWAHVNEEKNFDDYYKDQELTAMPVSGILEAYKSYIKNKPGDYILLDKDNLPVAYVYSTKVDLQSLIGKKVTLLGSPRPNNNFAFPAYFIHGVQ